ncbi:MAG: hypothetical protein ACI4B9_07205 [Eggerthellaceae bacterium]
MEDKRDDIPLENENDNVNKQEGLEEQTASCDTEKTDDGEQIQNSETEDTPEEKPTEISPEKEIPTEDAESSVEEACTATGPTPEPPPCMQSDALSDNSQVAEPAGQQTPSPTPAEATAKAKKSKTAVIVASIVGVVILVAVLVWCFAICHHKEWNEATCTEPRTCVECGKTEGDSLGHDYGEYEVVKEPTCEKDGKETKTCKRCGEEVSRSIDKLGHDFGKYSVTKEPTCVEEGTETRKCKRCGAKESRELDLVDHTPSEWQVTVDPYLDSNGNAVDGEWAILCTVCGEKLETEPYVMTADEIREAFIAACWTPTYDEIARDPDGWDGYKVALTGEVMQVSGSTILLQVTNKGYYWDDIVYVHYYGNGSGPRILEDDVVTFYGTMEGTYTYTTVMGASKTVPEMTAKYVG